MLDLTLFAFYLRSLDALCSSMEEGTAMFHFPLPRFQFYPDFIQLKMIPAHLSSFQNFDNLSTLAAVI